MTNLWMLSKESMKGMDILAVTNDVLYILEQNATGEKLLDEDLKKLRNGCALLEILASAAREQISKGQQKDLFMLRVVEFLEKTLGLQPSKLAERLEVTQNQLEQCRITSEITELFEQISKAVMSMTSRSVDAVSISLR
ncbi:MAG: hypothetical protein ABIH76_05690 [Candidatus Bathyarchaeota archaeon]